MGGTVGPQPPSGLSLFITGPSPCSPSPGRAELAPSSPCTPSSPSTPCTPCTPSSPSTPAPLHPQCGREKEPGWASCPGSSGLGNCEMYPPGQTPWGGGGGRYSPSPWDNSVNLDCPGHPGRCGRRSRSHRSPRQPEAFAGHPWPGDVHRQRGRRQPPTGAGRRWASLGASAAEGTQTALGCRWGLLAGPGTGLGPGGPRTSASEPPASTTRPGVPVSAARTLRLAGGGRVRLQPPSFAEQTEGRDCRRRGRRRTGMSACLSASVSFLQ